MGWFRGRSRTQNRRFERRQVLDVKVRSQHARSIRFGRVARVVTVLFAVLVVLFGAWRGGERALDYFVFENPVFAIKRIDVQAGGLIETEWIRHWSGVRLGENLFSLDLERVQRDLKMVSLIEEAWVERVVPDGLRLKVVERLPIARIQMQRVRASGGIERELYFVDRTGFVIKPLVPGEGRASLPPDQEGMTVLTGFGPFEVRPGIRLDSPKMRAAIDLIRSFEQSPMYGLVDLARIDLSLPDILVVSTGQGSEITLGMERVEAQLRRWRSVHDEALRLGAGLGALDLSVSNNLPVRWSEASVLPPPLPKRNPPGPAKPKKNHV